MHDDDYDDDPEEAQQRARERRNTGGGKKPNILAVGALGLAAILCVPAAVILTREKSDKPEVEATPAPAATPAAATPDVGAGLSLGGPSDSAATPPPAAGSAAITAPAGSPSVASTTGAPAGSMNTASNAPASTATAGTPNTGSTSSAVGGSSVAASASTSGAVTPAPAGSTAVASTSSTPTPEPTKAAPEPTPAKTEAAAAAPAGKPDPSMSYDKAFLASLESKARTGSLSDAEVSHLRGAPVADEAYGRASAVLAAHFEAKKNYKAHCEVANAVLTQGRYKYNPDWNLEAAKCRLRNGDFEGSAKAADAAVSAQMDLPAGTRPQRVLLAYQTKARARTAIFEADAKKNAGMVDGGLLNRAVGAWREVSNWAVSIGDNGAATAAAKEVADLEAKRSSGN